MKTYNKIEATLLAVETAVICASTFSQPTETIDGGSGKVVGDARQNSTAEAIFDFD